MKIRIENFRFFPEVAEEHFDLISLIRSVFFCVIPEYQEGKIITSVNTSILTQIIRFLFVSHKQVCAIPVSEIYTNVY